MSGAQFKDKFIAFVDILGYKNMVKAAESGNGLSISELKAITAELGKPDDKKRIVDHGPMICPESSYLSRDLDFQLTQVADCVIVSAEVSPAGVIQIISHCWSAALSLLSKGIMVRGYATRGLIYHEGIHFIGTGYQNAQSKEHDVKAFKKEANERGTPFIEIDPIISEYVEEHGDECVKQMFSRFIEGDGTVNAVFPFKRLSHSFIVAGGDSSLDTEKEKKSNQIFREWIQKFKERIMSFVDDSNPDALRKANHYISALNAQLDVCDETDQLLDLLEKPFSRG